MTVRRTSAFLATGAALALLVTGCTGTATPTQDLDPEITTSVPPATGEIEHIVWNNASGEPSSLDPAIAITGAESTIIPNLCEAVSVFDTEYGIRPALAETIDHPDETTWVFHLREGVTFWDGSPMTPEDVVYSIERVLDPATASPWAGWAVDPSVEATGDDEVTVRVGEYNSLIPVYFATPAFMVVKQAYTQEQGATFATPAGGLMCTGPYRLEGWDPGKTISIARNDGWWRRDALPKVASIDFTFVTDPAAQLAALSNGEVQGQWGIPISALDALAKTDGHLLFNYSLAQEFLSVLDQTGPLADVRVRQALQASIDYEGIISAFYRGTAEPLRAIVPPSAWGYAKDVFAEANEALPAPAFDLVRARELAQASGIGGDPIVLAFEAGDETEAKIATSIADNASQAGLNVELRPLDSDAYNAIFYSEEARAGIDVYLVLGFLDFPDPASYYQFFTTGHYYNFAGYHNEDFDAAIAQSLVTGDPYEKARLVSAAQRIMMEDLYQIPIYTPYLSVYYGEGLGGLVPHQSFLSAPWAATLGGR